MPDAKALGAFVAGQRWFAAKTRRIVAVEVEDEVPVGDDRLIVAGVRLDDGALDRYALPLRASEMTVDALDREAYPLALWTVVARGAHVRGRRGELVGIPTAVFPTTVTLATARRVGGEQSNTSLALGDTALLKHFRRLAPGSNPDAEIARFLTERAHFPHAPRLLGQVEYRSGSGDTYTLAVIYDLVRESEDGWTFVLGELERAFRAADLTAFLDAAEPALAALQRLGDVTAALHLALASDSRDPDFAPETVTASDVARWRDAVRRQLAEAERVLAGTRLPDVSAVGDGLAALLGTTRIRHHGDFHLGQTLYRRARGEWFVIDFEGEPLRPIAERRQKHAPLRDVAGMLRSIDYAAVSAAPSPGDARARAFERAGAARYLTGYRRGTAGAPFAPATDDAFTRAVAAFVVEKAAYEIVYEANHRPDWIRIPVDGLARAAIAISERPAGAA